MSTVLESALDAQRKAEADEADRRAQKALALHHYGALAEEAKRETVHERVARRIAEVLAEVKAQSWADESIDLVIEDLEAAVTHWSCVYEATQPREAWDAPEHQTMPRKVWSMR